MEKNRKTKKVIAVLLMLILVIFAVALAEYAMISRSYEENRKLRTAQKDNEQGENLAAVENKENESLDSALRRFKRNCAKAGIQQEIRKREHYEKPSVRRKKKSEAARKRKYN